MAGNRNAVRGQPTIQQRPMEAREDRRVEYVLDTGIARHFQYDSRPRRRPTANISKLVAADRR